MPEKKKGDDMVSHPSTPMPTFPILALKTSPPPDAQPAPNTSLRSWVGDEKATALQRIEGNAKRTLFRVQNKTKEKNR
jgi:hypothetical protein